MPIVPNNISELQFDERDLYLDVRLSTVSLDSTINRDEDSGLITDAKDFTGKPVFITKFFQESTGFGITNIKIETNASLQPIINMEFKDLYGKTVFGELGNSDTGGISYAALFQWPPPKFIFTFKGYLGSPVTWILNMKTTSTQYNSDDGSYTIKATFVPNQWGMFADIPFLYLYAAKKLRADSLGNDIDINSEEFKKKTEGIIDLMYIGKKINKTTKKSTKEYDSLVSKMRLLKSDPITALVSGNFSFSEPDNVINSAVPGRNELFGFKNLIITPPNGSIYNNKEDLKVGLKSLSVNARYIENLKIKTATQNINSNYGSLSNIKFGEIPSDDIIAKLKTQADALGATIEENIKIIDLAIKANIYEENKTELQKITISEVFSKIAKDTAYVLGWILDAGEQGYLNNKSERDDSENKGNSIGLYYPMKFNNSSTEEDSKDLAKQVPADGLGTDSFEKKFVNNFINAISYGIAENKTLQSQAEIGAENTINHRVSNLEIISNNPFKDITDWKLIASIIIKRSCVSGFITQSYDSNIPGDMDLEGEMSTFGSENATNEDEMIKSADSDVANIDDALLYSLDSESLESLKKFCVFWTSIISSPDGFNHLDDEDFDDVQWSASVPFGTDGFKNLTKKIFIYSPGISSLATDNSEAKRIIEKIRESWTSSKRFFKIEDEELGYSNNGELINDLKNQGVYDELRNVISYNSETGRELKKAGFEAYTVEQYLEQFIGENYLFYGRSRRQAIDGIASTRPTLNASFNFYNTNAYFINFNGLTFIHPYLVNNKKGASDYLIEYVAFSEIEDVQKVSENQNSSNPSDSGIKESEDEVNVAIDGVDEEVPYVTIISQSTVPEDSEKPEGDRQTNKYLEFFNEKSKDSSVFDYTWAKSQISLSEDLRNSFFDLVDVNGGKIRAISAVDYYKHSSVQSSVFKKVIGPGYDNEIQEYDIDVDNQSIVFAPYAQVTKHSRSTFLPNLAGTLFPEIKIPIAGTREDELAVSTRVFLRQFCKQLLAKITNVEEETSKQLGQILGRAGEHEDLIYQQMNTLFHQWQIMGADSSGKRINELGNPVKLSPNIANKLQESYGKIEEENETPDDSERDDGKVIGGGFRYDYPLQSIGKKKIDVSNAIINLDPLYSAKANTSVLNILQQLCSKNNFMFFPIAGNARYNKVTDIFKPKDLTGPKVGNFFQILFQPTPENRTLVGNKVDEKQSTVRDLETFSVEAFPVSFGDPTNKIIKNVVVSTDENKVTAESIVNLQRIVDNENSNRTVTTDCSLLSVLEGRSYKASLETIGNAQISPTQFFFLRNHTIFTGLYQIINVSHNITPNDMTTNFEGIKMRYGGKSYGGILPETLDTYKDAAQVVYKEAPIEEKLIVETDTFSDAKEEVDDNGNVIDEVLIENSSIKLKNDNEIELISINDSIKVSSNEIVIPVEVSNYFINTNRLKTSDNGTAIPNVNYTKHGEIPKSRLIERMNQFLNDRMKPFAEFLSKNYPQYRGKIAITSAIRGSIVKGSSSSSQHLRGEAIDFGLGGSPGQKLSDTFIIFNALMQFLRVNNLEWDQLLFETRGSKSVWLHWSYSRGHRINIYQNILRFHNDRSVKGAPVNNNLSKKTVESTAKNYSKSQVRVNSFDGSK